ncbi:MAG: ABC transporter permease [Balneola sp.]
MLKNYLKIAFRNLARNKSYSFINIFGLAIGLTCSILIGLYIIHELSYDKFHENGDRIYRVVESYNSEQEENWYATTFSALAPTLKNEFPSLRHVSHVYPTNGLVIGGENQKFQEDGIIYADSSFFEMFSFDLVSGDPSSVLNKPMSVVITPKIALKFFGEKNPVGQTLTFNGQRGAFELEITGVAETPPSNSHIQFDYVFSYESLRTIRPWEYNRWYYPPMYTYVELASNKSLTDLKAAFPGFQQKYVGAEAHLRNLDLQPISEIRLFSDYQNELSNTSDINYIYLFSAIGIFILLIACINFMNLATAKSMKRSREVGMRKTLGARRKQLIWQFLGEAFIITSISLILAILISEIILPYFNSISGKELSLGVISLSNWLLSIAGVVLIVGLIAGSYPAFYLSSFKPISVLKGNSDASGGSASFFRKGLVVFQFFISTGLIFATFVVTKQLDYVQNERLGFNKEQVAIIPVRETDDQFNIKTLKDEILRIPGVESAAAVSGVPGISSGIHDFGAVPEDNKYDTLVVMTITSDHSFVETLKLNLIEGRDFSESFGTDETQAFIINRTAAEKFGWDNPVGEELTLRFYVQGLIEKKGTVIGMVEDFQYHSLHSDIDPILIQVFSATFYHDYLAIRFTSDKLQSSLQEVEAKWSAFNPDRPFEYTFLDDTFDSMYKTEQQLSMIFNLFAVIAVIIACLGLFGLASYSTERRLKELGVRKVLGASAVDILTLLSKDFLKLVLIGFLISVPFAIFFMNEWLQNFSDRIEINFALFFFVAVVAISVAVIAVGYQSIRAALMNPVESLKSE